MLNERERERERNGRAIGQRGEEGGVSQSVSQSALCGSTITGWVLTSLIHTHLLPSFPPVPRAPEKKNMSLFKEDEDEDLCKFLG